MKPFGKIQGNSKEQIYTFYKIVLCMFRNILSMYLFKTILQNNFFLQELVQYSQAATMSDYTGSCL